jgi:hypothetical protein
LMGENTAASLLPICWDSEEGHLFPNSQFGFPSCGKNLWWLRKVVLHLLLSQFDFPPENSGGSLERSSLPHSVSHLQWYMSVLLVRDIFCPYYLESDSIRYSLSFGSIITFLVTCQIASLIPEPQLLQSQKWRQHFPSKHRYPPTSLRSVTTQKTTVLHSLSYWYLFFVC